MFQADLHNCVLLWLVAHSEIPRSICSGVLSQGEQNIKAEFWPRLLLYLIPAWRRRQEATEGALVGPIQADLSPALRQVGGSTLGGSFTGTGTSELACQAVTSWPGK